MRGLSGKLRSENDARGRAQFYKLRHLLLHDPDVVEKVIRALDYQRKRFPRRTRIGEVLRLRDPLMFFVKLII